MYTLLCRFHAAVTQFQILLQPAGGPLQTSEQ